MKKYVAGVAGNLELVGSLLPAALHDVVLGGRDLVAAVPISHDALTGLGEFEEETTVDSQPLFETEKRCCDMHKIEIETFVVDNSTIDLTFGLNEE